MPRAKAAVFGAHNPSWIFFGDSVILSPELKTEEWFGAKFLGGRKQCPKLLL